MEENLESNMPWSPRCPGGQGACFCPGFYPAKLLGFILQSSWILSLKAPGLLSPCWGLSRAAAAPGHLRGSPLLGQLLETSCCGHLQSCMSKQVSYGARGMKIHHNHTHINWHLCPCCGTVCTAILSQSKANEKNKSLSPGYNADNEVLN